MEICHCVGGEEKKEEFVSVFFKVFVFDGRLKQWMPDISSEKRCISKHTV